MGNVVPHLQEAVRLEPTALQAGRRWSAGVTTRAIASEPPILSIHARQLVVPPVAFGGAGDAAVLVGESFTSSYGHACGLRRADVQVRPLGKDLFIQRTEWQPQMRTTPRPLIRLYGHQWRGSARHMDHLLTYVVRIPAHYQPDCYESSLVILTQKD